MTYREAIVSGEKSLCEAGIADARNDAWLLLTMACNCLLYTSDAADE